MRITYIIGNGFDLALGLNTGYRAFLKQYLEELAGQNTPALLWLGDRIKTDTETWADAEWAFGQLTGYPAQNSEHKIEIFSACLQDFKSKFIKYLKDANRDFDAHWESIKTNVRAFSDGILGLGRYLRPAYAKEWNAEFRHRPVMLDFINLNYTDTLERIIEAAVGANRVFMTEGYTATLNRNCIYIHGSLKEDRIVFGVDNDEQIADAEIRAHCNSTKRLVKGYLDLGYDAEYEALQKIDQSEWIVTMGASYGATDKKVWDRVFTKVFRNRQSKLLIIPFCRESDIAAQVDGNDFIFNWTRRVFSSLLADNRVCKEVEDRIGRETMDRVRVCKPQKVQYLGEGGFCDFLHLTALGAQSGLIRTKDQRIADMEGRKRSIYESDLPNGEVTFDYKLNAGSFVISVRGEKFDTRWSRANVDSVHAYRDGAKRLGFSARLTDISASTFDEMDLEWERRAVTVRAGDMIILQNANDRFLGLKMIEVSDGGSEMSPGRIRLRYRLYDE